MIEAQALDEPALELKAQGDASAGFTHEAFSRNVDILDEQEQAALQSLRVLVAGCGSVGGAVVEPLARLGVTGFVLADPDVYEVSNLNRQACYVADLGRPKAAVLAERVLAINPYASAVALTEGVSTGNVEAALDGVGVVFDGIDGAMSPWEKYTLHATAARRRIPVVAGADFGGKPVLYVFDYRDDQRPFYGRGRSEHHRDGRFVESVRWLGYRPFPSDFLPVVADRLASGDPWPQIVYCVAAMGALGSRTVLDVALGRPVRHVIEVDVHQASRRASARAWERLRWPREAARALASAYRSEEAPPARATALPALPAALREALEAAREAPSAHNSQPWRFTVKGPELVQVDWDRSRHLAVADRDGHGVLYSIGCAIEAMDAVVEVDHEPPGPGHPLDPAWHAGSVALGPVRDEFQRAHGLVRYRGTTRTHYADDPLDARLLASLERAAATRGTGLAAIESRPARTRLAELTRDAATAQLADDAFLAELLEWIRFDQDDELRRPDGFTARTLALDPASARAMRLLRSSRTARKAARRFGLAETMGREAAAGIDHSGAVLLLTAAGEAPADRIAAGRAMMAVWLEATRLRLAVQPVFWSLESEPARTRTLELFGACGAPPVALLRVGYARSAPPSSLRLPLERVCTIDRAAWSAAASGTTEGVMT